MKVFAGGSKTINNIVDLPNRRVLDVATYYGDEILVGDCDGADAAIQRYLAKDDYPFVTVYVSGDKVRNNIGDWPVKHVVFDPTFTGYDFRRQKDIQMALDCDGAVMAWDGKSKGTRQNIIDVLALDKSVENMLWKSELDEWYCLDGSVDGELIFGKGDLPEKINIWLDDMRPAPDGYYHCRSVNEVKLYIETAEKCDIDISVIDCDHDLGISARLGGDGIKLLDWLAERGTFYPVELHTMNAVGYSNMRRMIERYWKQRE